MFFSRSSLIAMAVLLAGMLSTGTVCGITIDIRYDLDDNGFFAANPEAKDALEFAARAFEPFADNLLEIGPEENWNAAFFHPGTGTAGSSIANLAVPADTIIVFAGARDLPLQQVGQGSPGFGPTALVSRGQGTTTGILADDFGLWGGTIAFDTMFVGGAPRNWNFDVQSAPSPGQIDFLSVAIHELAHVLGFGFTLSNSFQNQVTSGFFQGVASTELYGGPVPMTVDLLHWSNGVTSPPFVNEPDTAMNSTINFGVRKAFTPLDYAGLKDVGWEVPEQLLGLPADLDVSGTVDGGDFLAWQRGFGQSDGGLNQLGDATGEGTVDDFDLWLWQRNFGARKAPTEFSAGQIPEPTTATLLLLFLAATTGRQCRRIPPA